MMPLPEKTAGLNPEIAVLREQLRRFEKRWLEQEADAVVGTGEEAIDSLLPHGGFPAGALSEINGALGGGRMTVAWRVMAIALEQGGLAACVDGPGWLYPPGANEFGVQWRRLCLVRPPEGKRDVWAAEQLIRSGCFKVVVLYRTTPLSEVQGRRLHRAAEAGRTVVLLVGSERPSRGLPVTIRLQVSGHEEGMVRLSLQRAKGMTPGKSAELTWERLMGFQRECGDASESEWMGFGPS